MSASCSFKVLVHAAANVGIPPILSNTELPNLGNFGLVVTNSVKGEALS